MYSPTKPYSPLLHVAFTVLRTYGVSGKNMHVTFAVSVLGYGIVGTCLVIFFSFLLVLEMLDSSQDIALPGGFQA